MVGLNIFKRETVTVTYKEIVKHQNLETYRSHYTVKFIVTEYTVAGHKLVSKTTITEPFTFKSIYEAEDYVAHVDAPSSEIECASPLIKAYKLSVKDDAIDRISEFLNMNGIKQECGIFIAVIQPVWNASAMFNLIPALQEDGHVYVVTDDIKHALAPCHYTFDNYSRDATVPIFASSMSGISFVRRSIDTCLALCPHILDKLQTQTEASKPKRSQEPSLETVWSNEPKDIDAAINKAIYDDKVSSLKESVKTLVDSELNRIEKYKDFLLKLQDM